MLHEEINRLPGRYRNAIVLCDLEGQTCEQAARTVGCPVGTLKCWRARGRERLRLRLSVRGLAPSIVCSGPSAFMEAVPKVLMESTVEAVTRFAGNGSAAGIGSAAAVDLTRGALRTMYLTRMLTIAFASVLVGALTVGVGISNHAGGAVNRAVVGEENGPQSTKSVRWLAELGSEALVSTPIPAEAPPVPPGELVPGRWNGGDIGERTTLKQSGWVWAVAFSPDGKLLATGGMPKGPPTRGWIKLWDTSTWKERSSFTVDATRVQRLAFSPAGGELIVVGWDYSNLVRLDIGSGKQRTVFMDEHSAGLQSARYSPPTGAT